MKRTKSHIRDPRRGRRTQEAPALSEQSGFTLLEIIVALGILATSVVILLESHYGSLRLFDAAQEAAFMDGLLEHALGESERDILAGNLSGEGDFGRRHPDFSFSFSAEESDPEEMPGLFEVVVTVRGPFIERETVYLAFDGNQLESS